MHLSTHWVRLLGHRSGVHSWTRTHRHWHWLPHHVGLSHERLLRHGLLVHGMNLTCHSSSHWEATSHVAHHSALHGLRRLVGHSRLGRRTLWVWLRRWLVGHASSVTSIATATSSPVVTTASHLVMSAHHASTRIPEEVVRQIHAPRSHHSRQRHQHLHEHLHLVLRLLLLALQVLHAGFLALELVHVECLVALLDSFERLPG